MIEAGSPSFAVCAKTRDRMVYLQNNLLDLFFFSVVCFTWPLYFQSKRFFVFFLLSENFIINHFGNKANFLLILEIAEIRSHSTLEDKAQWNNTFLFLLYFLIDGGPIVIWRDVIHILRITYDRIPPVHVLRKNTS